VPANGSRLWAQCKDVLQGHPAFVLGNDPFLPADLTVLGGLFSVGVNRILERCDPTVLMWLDPEVGGRFEGTLETSPVIPITLQEINWDNQWWGLEAVGDTGRRSFDVPDHPGLIPITANSGVSAALWARSLGCQPVYLVGMSATYDGTRTNFYGHNPGHIRSTPHQLGRALKALLTDAVFIPIHRQDELTGAAVRHVPMGRAWYRGQLEHRLSGLHPG